MREGRSKEEREQARVCASDRVRVSEWAIYKNIC